MKIIQRAIRAGNVMQTPLNTKHGDYRGGGRADTEAGGHLASLCCS